jgi:hypothetical protein
MTEQEIEQARADVDKLDIAQLRCGVLLQLLHIEALKKERDALAADASRYRWLRSSRHNDATVMTYVDGLDDWVAWADGEDVDTSVDTAMSQAGVSVERDALAAAAKLALDSAVDVYATCDRYGNGDQKAMESLSKAITALRQAGVQ